MFNSLPLSTLKSTCRILLEPLRHFRNAAHQQLHTRLTRQRTQDFLHSIERNLVELRVNSTARTEVAGAVIGSTICMASQLGAELLMALLAVMLKSRG